MPDVAGIMHIGRQALSAHQQAIAVTSGNIANVSTAGYSRKQVVYEATSPTVGFGAGVQIAQVRSVVDLFLQRQIISEQSSLGRFTLEKGALDRIELIFHGASGDGVSKAIGDFFSAVNDLSNNPAGIAERNVLLERGSSLSQTIHVAYTQLQTVLQDMNSEITARVDEINAIAGKIADLNKQIRSIENLGTGMVANDLRDDRVRLLGELSEKIEIHLLEEKGGDLTVTVGSGGRIVPLVSGEHAYALSMVADPNNSGFSKILSGDTDMTHAIANGRLRGLMELRDNLLPAYIDQLNKLAGSIVSEFNTQHQQGFDLSGEAGGDFFSPLGEPDQDAANLMAVSISDPKKIAAASSADELPGGNGNAILLAKLQDKQVSSLNATFQGFYANFTGEVGARAALSQRNLSVEEVVSQQLDTMREGISGVSLDEEMTNLISFQRAYQASAKLVVTADELLQTVIGMKQ